MTPTALRDLLVSWANINSGSSNVPGLERMRGALAEAFGTLRDAAVESVPLSGTAAQALRVRIRPSASRHLLLSGHYDTVYGAEHPFQVCTLVDETTLRGPGVADMKGGLVIMLAALRQFESSAAAEGLGFEILLTPDEETGSVATRPKLEEAARSGRFEFALVFEPSRSNGDLIKSRKGTGIFTLRCHGRAAHAGRDGAAGRNAIVALAGILPAVDALAKEIPGVMVNIGSIRGGGTVNIVPDFAEAQINLRIARAADEAAVQQRLREIIAPVNARDGYRLELTGAMNRPPKEVGPFEERLFSLWQSTARENGVALWWQDVAGGSDGNLLSAAGLPNLDGLGAVGDHLHSAEEFVHLPSLAERAKIAGDFFEKIATSDVV